MASPRRKSPTTAEVSFEMERYFKYLFYKMSQVVVQSRQGEKMCTPSSAVNNFKAWFTLAIQDIGEITYEAKRIIQPYLNSQQGILVTPLCIEISLKTAEGDSMVLETWVMSLKSNLDDYDGNDEESKSANVVYNHMGMLMKSLICVTRALPAYKLSRRQGPDSFVIFYRIYSGEAMSNLLGEGQQTCPIGQVSSPCGTLSVRVDYRAANSMTIDPSTRSSIHLHLTSNPLGQPILPRPAADQGDLRYFRHRSDTFGSNRISDDSEQAITSDESSELRIFASSPPDPPPHLGERRKFSDDDSVFSERMKFGAFSSRKGKNVQGTSMSEEEEKDFNKSDPLLELFTVDNEDDRGNEEKYTKPIRTKLDTMSLKDDDSSEPTRPRTNSLDPSKLASGRGGGGDGGMKIGTGGGRDTKSELDFEFLDFKAPFSAKSAEVNSNDLGVFFKDVQHATTILKTIAEETLSPTASLATASAGGLQNQLQDLNEQLTSFESNLAEYDEMLKTLETSESESDIY